MSRVRRTADVDYLVREYLAGKSTNQLSHEVGLTRGSIDMRLRERGIKLRSQSESETLKWSRMTPEQVSRQVAAANAASRGTPKSFAQKCKTAITVESNGRMNSDELLLSILLCEREIICTPQKAIGPYNCDLAASPVAVEIFGGHWHWEGKHFARLDQRVRYILNAGWHLLMIPNTFKSPLTPAIANYVATYIQEARRDPTRRREYRMVWCAGQFTSAGYADDDHISIEPPLGGGFEMIASYDACRP